MAYFPPNPNGATTASASSPVTLATDDALVAATGAIADASVVAGATGSISAKLRRLTTDVSAMSAKLPAALGQAAMAASMSTTIASDQSAVPTKTTTKLKGYTAAIATVLTTGLDGLANNNNSAASSTIDNTSNLDKWMDLELNLGTQSARSAGATVLVYMLRSIDGTNFDTLNETSAALVATFPLPATTAATRASAANIRVGPGKWQLFVRNQTNVAFAASGNTLSHRFYSEQNV